VKVSPQSLSDAEIEQRLDAALNKADRNTPSGGLT
jgi:hypothetical protein